ncbi:MAG: S-layer homology domain-containing protein [Eubacteriales bacterium]|nr:S-layer homology domain-containing protein [Eubacteriales bacterium]
MKKKFISLFLATCMAASAMSGALATESKIEGEEDVTLAPVFEDDGDIRSAQYNSDGKLVITLDPGHGGYDSGATHTWDGKTILEKNLNLKIALACKEELEKYEDVTVYMTRSDDTYIGLADRVVYAKEHDSDIIVSMHNNDAGNGTTGAMVLISRGEYRPELAEIARGVGTKILEQLSALGLKNRGFLLRSSSDKPDNYYPNGAIMDYYSIVRNATLQNMPGMIIEHAFLDSYSDYKNYLSTDEKLKALGVADAKAIVEYYDLSLKGASKTAAELGDAPFTDVRNDKWYYNAAVFCYQNNLMQGTSKTEFSPNVIMTRAMFVQALYNYAKPAEKAAATTFTDVNQSSWYYDAVCWAEQNKISEGMGDGTFAPNAKITREQFIRLMFAYAGAESPQDGAALKNFSDGAKVAEWAVPSMCWAIENGIVVGDVQNGVKVLDPKGQTTRAQAASVLKGYVENIVNKKPEETKPDETKPNEGEQTPSVDETKPDTNEQTPSTDEQTPNTDDKAPSDEGTVSEAD